MSTCVITRNASATLHLAGMTAEQFSAMDSYQTTASPADFWTKCGLVEWDFDFAANPGVWTAEGAHVSFVYPTAGTRTVRALAHFMDGTTATATATVTTTVAPSFALFDRFVDPLLGSDALGDGSALAPWASAEHAFYKWRTSGLPGGANWGRISIRGDVDTPYAALDDGVNHYAHPNYGPLLVTVYGGTRANLKATAAVDGKGINLASSHDNNSYSAPILWRGVNLTFNSPASPDKSTWNLVSFGHVGTQLEDCVITNAGILTNDSTGGGAPHNSYGHNIQQSKSWRNGLFLSSKWTHFDACSFSDNGSLSDFDRNIYVSAGAQYWSVSNATLTLGTPPGTLGTHVGGIKTSGAKKGWIFKVAAHDCWTSLDVGGNSGEQCQDLVYEGCELFHEKTNGIYPDYLTRVSVRNLRAYGGCDVGLFTFQSYSVSEFVQNFEVIGGSFSEINGPIVTFNNSDVWSTGLRLQNCIATKPAGLVGDQLWFFTCPNAANLTALTSENNQFNRAGGAAGDPGFAYAAGANHSFSQWKATDGKDNAGPSGFGDPLFRNVASLDLTLLAGSPAIDAGAALYTLTEDAIGTRRPIGAGWDRGALEAAAGAPPILGTGRAPLGPVGVSGVGTVAPPVAGAGVAALGPVGVVGVGTVSIVGAAVAALGPVGVIGVGSVSSPINGDGVAALGGVGIVGYGTVEAPVGAIVAQLANEKVRVTFTEHPTHAVVLHTIENLVDGSVIELDAVPLFKVVLRKLGALDEFVDLEPTIGGGATSFIVQPVGRDDGAFHIGGLQESPGLGPRSYFQFDVHFREIEGTREDLKVSFTCCLLDEQPDRVLFAAYLDPSFGDTLTSYGIFWCAPIQIAPFAFDSDHYLIGMNGGLATRNPQVDLLGDGAGYRFNTGVGFEPETKSDAQSDRMEVFYPERLSMALSAYGDRGIGGATVYVHDDLSFRGRRIVDTYENGHVLLSHEALVENGITTQNGWSLSGDQDLRSVKTYVRVFKRIGQILGEDVGLDYKRWALSSSEGRLVRAHKPKDRADMATLQTSPMYVAVCEGDSKGETDLSIEIAKELRMAFPSLPIPISWMAAGTDVAASNNFWSQQKTSGTHSGNVGDAVPDLYDIKVDTFRLQYAQSLRAKGLLAGGYVAARRPTPYDGLGYWNSTPMDTARVQNHLEAADPANYKTTDQWLKVTRTVAAVESDDQCHLTKITLDTGFFADPSLFNIQVAPFEQLVYALMTAGIDHSTHPEHLGWLRKSDQTYAFPIEKQNELGFRGNPPVIYVGDDQTATIHVGDTLELFFMQLSFIPGYDAGTKNQVGDNAGTSLCGMADDVGQGLPVPAAGWAFRFVGELFDKFLTWAALIANRHTFENLVCWSNHGGEIPGSNQALLAWRRILTAMRANIPAPYQFLEESGPYDWEVGITDGFARTQVRRELTTQAGSWGASPLFQVAWGAWQRSGMYANQGAGHVTNLANASGAYAAFYEGTGAKVFRESLVSDFLLGKLPTLSISPVPTDAMGTRPDGQPGYTPFFHAQFGMSVASSMAALFARLVNLHLVQAGITVAGQRVRSLERRGKSLVPSNLNVLPGLDGHDLPGTEYGSQRPPLFHAVFRDPTNPRRLVAIFINDSKSPRGDSYTFHPGWYFDTVPLGHDGYVVTQGYVLPTSVSGGRLGFFHGNKDFAVALQPGEVFVMAFEFSSGLRFRYGYDDEPLREVPIPIDQTKVTIADLHGSGAKLQIGFANDLPDQDFKISAADLRVFKQGQSESK